MTQSFDAFVSEVGECFQNSFSKEVRELFNISMLAFDNFKYK